VESAHGKTKLQMGSLPAQLVTLELVVQEQETGA
jgi:hypothetical protein